MERCHIKLSVTSVEPDLSAQAAGSTFNPVWAGCNEPKKPVGVRWGFSIGQENTPHTCCAEPSVALVFHRVVMAEWHTSSPSPQPWQCWEASLSVALTPVRSLSGFKFVFCSASKHPYWWSRRKFHSCYFHNEEGNRNCSWEDSLCFWDLSHGECWQRPGFQRKSIRATGALIHLKDALP